MKTTHIIITISACIFIAACAGNKPEIENNGCTPYTDLYILNYDSLKSDPINVIDIEVIGDCLNMKVSYGGCTKDHPIHLAYIHPKCGTPPLPPPTFEIRHDSRGELCKMLVTNNLSFDLTPIRTESTNEVSFIVSWNTDSESIKTVDLIYKY